MLLQEFKKIVNATELGHFPKDLREIYQILDLPDTGHLTNMVIHDRLCALIKEALAVQPAKEVIRRSRFLKLQQELLYRHVLYNEELEPYLSLVKWIREGTKGNAEHLAAMTKLHRWESAILNAKRLQCCFPDTNKIMFDVVRNEDPKAFDIALAAKRLSERGCIIEILNSNIAITKGLNEIVTEIEENIKAIGGLTLIQHLLGFLKHNNHYSTHFERYYLIRQTSGLTSDQKPQVPFGYLLNVCLKYPYHAAEGEYHERIKEIIELSVLLVTGAYGVQPYSQWEFFFQKGDTLVEFVTDLAVWDTIYGLSQCKPDIALLITEALMRCVPDVIFECVLGFDKAVFFKLWALINKLFINHTGAIFDLNGILKQIPEASGHTIQKILDLLSHSGSANHEYQMPVDYTKINYFLKPFIKIGDFQYLMPDRSWSAPNFFEALMSALRPSVKELDKQLGLELELFLKEQCHKNGQRVVSGDYYQGKNRVGDCDLVMETDQAIVFIEFKKKTLTRDAKSGNDMNILLDLADSLLTAQLQAGKAEISLRKTGKLELKSISGEIHKIALNGRQVTRIALTHQDFGGFQDRNILKSFLTSLLTHSYTTKTTDVNIQKKFTELESKRQKWTEQYQQLMELDPLFARNPFFDCWFLNLPQLLEIVFQSDSNDKFYQNLNTTKFMTTASLDWYQEMDHMRKIKENRSKK